MRISIGSDHRGVEIRSALSSLLTDLGHTVVEEGPCEPGQAVDYPDIAASVARQTACGSVDRGILVCGTGIGMAITANKFPNVRAAVCGDEATARLCRQHNDVNVLCLSGELPEADQSQHIARLKRIVLTWLETPFEGGRHARRVAKIAEYERTAREAGCRP
jgi:ribose 5-phosphate isomerase B